MKVTCQLYILIIFFMQPCSFLVGEFELLQPDSSDTITIIKKISKPPKTLLTVIKSKKGIYLVKENKLPEVKHQFAAIREVFGSYIAEKMGIPAHRVRMLPASFSFPGKSDANRLATIHTFVPGEPVELALPPYNVNLRQRMKGDEVGLGLRILRDLKVHPILSVIIAFDTYCSNNDRSKTNLLYDKKSNSFFAIDHEKCFRYAIGWLACRNVSKILRTHVSFTISEQQGIIIFRNTLKRFLREFPPHLLISLFKSIIEESNITSCFKDSSLLEKMIKYHQKNILSNCKAVRHLIFLLDRLICTFPMQRSIKLYYPKVTLHDNRSFNERIKIYEKICST